MSVSERSRGTIIIPRELPERHSLIARKQLHVFGDPYAPKIINRFLKHTVMNDCWLWKRGHTADGYARFWMYGQYILLHRWVYILFNGKIPDGLELDHTCRNRSCVNPFHLEAVTHQENVLRGNGLAAINARKTHCIHGHPFDKENTYIRLSGKRQCKICKVASDRRKAI